MSVLDDPMRGAIAGGLCPKAPQRIAICRQCPHCSNMWCPHLPSDCECAGSIRAFAESGRDCPLGKHGNIERVDAVR